MQWTRVAWLALAPLVCSACHPQGNTDAGESASTAPAAPPAAAAAPPAAAHGPSADPADETALQYTARMKDAPSTPDPSAIRPIPACIGCHGPDGAGVAALHTPRIGGLEAWYLARQLRYFQRGTRGMQTDDAFARYMHAFALMLDGPAEIDGLAAYFAARTPAPMDEPAPHGDAEHGHMLYQVCSACHGPDAVGNAELNAPGLTGQSPSYLVRQLEDYRNGLRGTADTDIFGKQMQPIAAATLKSSQDSADVVAFIETLAAKGDATKSTAEESAGRTETGDD